MRPSQCGGSLLWTRPPPKTVEWLEKRLCVLEWDYALDALSHLITIESLKGCKKLQVQYQNVLRMVRSAVHSGKPFKELLADIEGASETLCDALIVFGDKVLVSYVGNCLGQILQTALAPVMGLILDLISFLGYDSWTGPWREEVKAKRVCLFNVRKTGTMVLECPRPSKDEAFRRYRRRYPEHCPDSSKQLAHRMPADGGVLSYLYACRYENSRVDFFSHSMPMLSDKPTAAG